MAVAMARHRRPRRVVAGTGLRRAAARVALAAERGFQLGFEQLLDEGADAGAHPGLQRIKPVFAEKTLRLGRTRGWGCDICRHGVISAGAPTPVMACGTSRRLRRPHIPTTAPTAPGLMVLLGQSSGAVEPIDLNILAQKGSLYLTRPTLRTYADKRTDLLAMAQDLFDVVLAGAVKIEVNQTYPLRDAIKAHQDLQARKTTGSTVLTL